MSPFPATIAAFIASFCATPALAATGLPRSGPGLLVLPPLVLALIYRRRLRPLFEQARRAALNLVEQGPIRGGLPANLAFAGVVLLALWVFWGAGW